NAPIHGRSRVRGNRHLEPQGRLLLRLLPGIRQSGKPGRVRNVRYLRAGLISGPLPITVTDQKGTTETMHAISMNEALTLRELLHERRLEALEEPGARICDLTDDEHDYQPDRSDGYGYRERCQDCHRILE